MQRFILVDHSITGLAGHHYEYAVHVLRAAERAGYEPVLVTNRKFRERDLPWTVLPLFEFGFWPEKRAAVSWKLAAKAAAWLAPRFSRMRIRLRYSEIMLAWQSRKSWSKYLRRRRGEGAPLAGRAAAAASIVFFQVARLLVLAAILPFVLLIGLPVWALAAGGRYAIRTARSLAREERPPARTTFRNVVRAALEKARRSANPGILGGLERALRKLSEGGQSPDRQAQAFGRDSRRMLKQTAPRSDEIIFFPTISEHDLRGLAEELDRARLRPEAGWHFLFRRNIYTGARASYAAQDAGLEELRLVFERVRGSVLAGQSHFYTDTEELTEQYNRLGIVPFHTLPVPHTYSAADRIPHTGPLRLTYLGDARTEKGFALLPDLAARLEFPYLAAGRARFVLQCNYNIPGGEPRVALALGELEGMARYIDFHRRPLTSEEYRDLLLQADVNLLCYDPRNYYARSSGILVESLAVGIPVIVPGGCWLSRQFCARQGDYIDETRAQMTLLAASSLAELRWEGGATKGSNGRMIRVGHDAGVRVVLDVPHGATHVAARGAVEVGRDALVSLTDIGWDDKPVPGSERSFRLETPDGSDRCAFLAEMRPNVPRVSLSLATGHLSENTWFRTIDFEFLRAPEGRRFPRGVVGLSYETPREIPELLSDLIDHYPHYRRTATEFSKTWREYHNPDRLLREMRRFAGVTPAGSAPLRAQAERVAF